MWFFFLPNGSFEYHWGPTGSRCTLPLRKLLYTKQNRLFLGCPESPKLVPFLPLWLLLEESRKENFLRDFIIFIINENCDWITMRYMVTKLFMTFSHTVYIHGCTFPAANVPFLTCPPSSLSTASGRHFSYLFYFGILLLKSYHTYHYLFSIPSSCAVFIFSYHWYSGFFSAVTVLPYYLW